MNTNPLRLQEYARVGETFGSLADAATMPFEEIDRLLSTSVELPDGRLVACRDLTRADLAAISDYMRAHAPNVVVAEGNFN